MSLSVCKPFWDRFRVRVLCTNCVYPVDKAIQNATHSDLSVSGGYIEPNCIVCAEHVQFWYTTNRFVLPRSADRHIAIQLSRDLTKHFQSFAPSRAICD